MSWGLFSRGASLVGWGRFGGACLKGGRWAEVVVWLQEMDGSGPKRRDLTVLVLPSAAAQIRGFVRQLQQRVSIECKVLLLPLAAGAPAADPTQKSLLEREGEGSRQLLIFGDA